MSRRSIVVLIGLLAVAAFASGYLFLQDSAKPQRAASPQAAAQLVRAHSPVIGRTDAPVTIVEFFDPSCETCRAFYPVVKQIMDAHPNDVRLVLRYTPFHEGSDEAVRILETARMQGKFLPVLEALLAKQPEWAVHGRPQLEKAWSAAASAGLDLQKARQAMLAPEITAALNQDIADIKSVGVQRTPTFFVNGKPLVNFGAQQLYDLVRSEINAIR